MRTTLNVDDDVLEVAKRTAHIRRISVGEALSEMARQAMNTPVGLREDPETGFLVFDLPDTPQLNLTLEDIHRMQDEEDLDKYLDLMKRLEAESSAKTKKHAQSVAAQSGKIARKS